MLLLRMLLLRMHAAIEDAAILRTYAAIEDAAILRTYACCY